MVVVVVPVVPVVRFVGDLNMADLIGSGVAVVTAIEAVAADVVEAEVVIVDEMVLRIGMAGIPGSLETAVSLNNLRNQ